MVVATPDQARAADPRRSVWVSANAGSGKTHVLVDRVVRLMLEGAEPSAILCLTFTKAAAAEMEDRLLKRLGGWIALSDAALRDELKGLGLSSVAPDTMRRARQLFARAIETPGGLRIETIHAFCERLLQLFPVESGLAPGFRIMDEPQAHELEEQAFRAVLAEKTTLDWSFLDEAGVASFEDFRKLSEAFLGGTSFLRAALEFPAELPHINEKILKALGAAGLPKLDDITTDLLTIDQTAFEKAITVLQGYKPPKNFDLVQRLKAVLSAKTDSERRSALTSAFLTKELALRDKYMLKDTSVAEPAIHQWVRTEAQRIEIGLHREVLRKSYDTTCALLQAMSALSLRISAMKQARGLYGFDDLITRAALLLGTNAQAQWVLYKLDKGIDHILLDESQDTSPAQWEIIRRLAEEFFAGGEERPLPRSLFVVGDHKQSIFSFQGADAATFFNTRKALTDHALDQVELTVSYRSTPEILETVDHVFRDGSEAAKGFGLDEERRTHEPTRKTEPGLFELWPLVKPTDKEEPQYWKAPVDREPEDAPRRILARQIAEAIASWIGRRELAAKKRAVQPGDILILLQKRTGPLFPSLLAELRRLKVPVAGADRLELSKSLIITDLLAVGQFLRQPDDDHTLACLLKSPLVPRPLDEDQLIALAAKRSGCLLQALRDDAGKAENLRVVEGWMESASKLGPFAFYASVLMPRMESILRRLGSEAEDSALAFLDMAADFETQNSHSLVAFLDWFRSSEAVLKREMDKAQGEVRIMTAHSAKGLQAPIVILADAADRPLRSDSSKVIEIQEGEAKGYAVLKPESKVKLPIFEHWNELRKAEELKEKFRLLYVAMTRAEDELYVCGSYTKSKPDKNCWYSLIEEAFAETTSAMRLAEEPRWHDGALVRRRGRASRQATEIEKTAQSPTSLPEWTRAVETARPMRQQTRTTATTSTTIDWKAAKQGRAVHKFLELLSPDEDPQKALARAARLGVAQDLAERLLDLVRAPEVAPLFGPDSRGEVIIGGTLDGLGRVSGRIDRLAEGDGVITLLDFKSGFVPAKPPGPEHEHVQQLAIYAALLQAASPVSQIKAGLLWTQSGRLDWISPDVLSQALDQRRALTRSGSAPTS